MANSFIVTQTGLNAAVAAANTGIKVTLSTFRVGSAFGYQPTVADTSLHGTTLYTDNVTNWSNTTDGTLIISCTINVEAGPFDFGEIGIYTDTGALFCLMALPKLYNKAPSLGTNESTTFTFNAYLRLGQSTTYIQVTTGGITNITYSQVVTALGYTPYNSTNPNNYITQASAVAPNSNPQFNSIGVGIAATGITGNIFAIGNIQGFQASDLRYKTNLKPIVNPLEMLAQLQGYFHGWTDEYIAEQGGLSTFVRELDISLIAQEVQKILPMAVGERLDGKLGMQYDKLIPLIVSGINVLARYWPLMNDACAALAASNRSLTSRVAALEGDGGVPSEFGHVGGSI